MPEEIRKIQMSKLLAHPDNPNVMSEVTFRKLVRNIERTGLYEPIVVRIHPDNKGSFQIINGHHRVKALEQLHRKEANCIVWDVDDGETNVLLATLNRLGGSAIPAKKIELLKKLTERMATARLAKLLPQTAKQIERLTNLKLSAIRCTPALRSPELVEGSGVEGLHAEQFAVPLVFFVSQQQKDIIEKSLEAVLKAPNLMLGVNMVKAQRRAAAITEMASEFMKTENARH
jgi:hypothetical protein